MLTRQDMIGPWAGLPVAWDEKLNFDEQTYRADLERTCKAGVPGVYWMTQEFNYAGRTLYDRVGTRTPFIKYSRPST